MKKKKIPQRMCVGCQEMKSKKEFIRVVKPQEGDITIDPTGKKPGRGAYICPEIDCFKKAYKSKRLDKALKTAVPHQVYQSLEDRLSD
ncbi:YlxR family protein [Proteinivorax hydrogeniformans]|uniref:YlxR family protein n=1 Tax=Proteinivorax hydrogeniformans TaxID=1826727 RepID=A0AAU8HNW8_9FIRM